MASTDPIPPLPAAVVPIPLAGLRLHCDESPCGLPLSLHPRPSLALERGYTDLGNIGNALPFFPVVTPDLNLGPGSGFPDYVITGPITTLPPDVLSGLPLTPVGLSAPPLRPAALDSQQLHVGAKLSAPLRDNLSGHWYLGLGRTDYDAQGALAFVTLSTPVMDGPIFSFPTTNVTFPNAAPDSETALIWGFGFDYTLRDDLALDLSWRRHDNDVLAADTITLGINWRPQLIFKR